MDQAPGKLEGERRDIDAQRHAWEAERIAEARRSAAAGHVVDSSKVKAWIDSIATDNPLPPPYARR